MERGITSRLYAGFSAAVLLVIVIGIISYQTVKRQSYFQEWVHHTYQVTNEVKSLHIKMIEMRGSRRAFRLTGNDSFLLAYKLAIPQIFDEVNKLSALVTDNQEQAKKVDSIDAELKQLVGFWENTKNDSIQNNGYKTRITLEEEAKIDVLRRLINTINAEEQRLLALREGEYEKANGTASQILVTGTILVLLIVVILIFYIVRELRNRGVAETNLQKSINNIKALIEDADKRNWQLTGITKITDGMHAAYSLAGLVNNIIKNLTDYIGLPAAVFYLFDEDKQVLTVKASAGTVFNEEVSFKPSQLPGGLPVAKEIRILKQVPENFWTIHSAMGSAKPVELASIGLYIGRELKGVVELASFSGFSPEQVELLRAVSDNMAVSLHAAQTRERVIHLLEQVQEQKEILENQQEELRLTNEELTRQAEILQASEEELKVQEEELRHINAELESRNEAVETARLALQEKAKELDAVSRYKSEFLANMSHELRTPLNSILILANLLADNKQKNLTEKQTEYAGIIHKSGNELLNLINDILDLSKIESGKVELQPERVTIDNIAEDIVPQFKVLAEEKKINFTTRIDVSVPDFIVTDKLKLQQVLKNLLSNAFKFTGTAGAVTLQFYQASDEQALTIAGEKNILAISVTDTGIGISAEKQRLIFEAFQQADGSTSRKYGGTGLGLSISKELVRLLGGVISLTSTPGAGSCFTVLLPQQQQGKQVEKGKETIQTFLPSPSAQQQIKDDRDRINRDDKIMLIVEDDVKFAVVLQDFARERQYKTIIALSGDEGLMYASKYMPSAIILDIQLPVLDGWSVLKALKKNNKLKHIPVHIISVMDSPGEHTEGALAYLKKPVDNQSLEKAFDLIGNYLAINIKKVLFYSGGHLSNNELQDLLHANKITALSTVVNTVADALAILKQEKFDCIIVDIGENINDGIEQLSTLKEFGALDEVPLIIYLDEDISEEDEWKLKKFSTVVIRHSEHARQRLMDELELFLHKIKQSQKKQVFGNAISINDDLLAGKKVLLVDDDMRNVFALSVTLEEHKMTVYTANNGKEAIEVLTKNKDISIVLMDIMMPEMDGYEAMRYIRTSMKLENLPVIALTAKAMQGDFEKSIQAGASDYIAKPVDINKLLSAMRVWLAR